MITWTYCGINPDHTLQFWAPKEYGEYELRYFHAGSWISSGFTIAMQYAMDIFVLNPTAAQADERQTLHVSYHFYTKRTHSRDWVGLFPAQETSNYSKYIHFQYCPPYSEPAGGSMEFSFQKVTEPGEYKLCWFTYNISNSTPHLTQFIKVVKDQSGSLVPMISPGQLPVEQLPPPLPSSERVVQSPPPPPPMGPDTEKATATK